MFSSFKLISPFDAQIPSAPGHETAPSSLSLRPTCIGRTTSSFARLLQGMRQRRSDALRPSEDAIIVCTTDPGHETAPFEPSFQTNSEDSFIICTIAPGHETAPFKPISQIYWEDPFISCTTASGHETALLSPPLRPIGRIPSSAARLLQVMRQHF